MTGMVRKMTMSVGALIILAWYLAGSRAHPSTVSALLSRGYTVIPQPQTVQLKGREFALGPGWRLDLARGVSQDEIAVEDLKEGLASRFHLALATGAGRGHESGVIRMSISPGSVKIGDATDRNRASLEKQAYRLDLGLEAINLAANAAPGLFYGVETLLQLIKSQGGSLWLPEGEIVDWPDLELREIYWDDAHHLERLDVLKDAIRRAAFFKINGFAIKLEGHFQYQSAPALVEPYALSPAELQELTDYALRRHVELVPYLDGPSHIAFILKHPEYKALREYPQSNYELCTTNPDSYKLLFGMYEDLLAGNKGGKYFHLSTDEPYYVGLADNPQCHEAPRARELGSVGQLLAEFITKTANFLHDRGRTVIFWGEVPLRPDDIASLPQHLVNGEVYGPEFDPVFKTRGIRQMVYISTQGEERLFPDYYLLPPTERLHPRAASPGRVPGMFEHVSYGAARQQADLMGVVDAAWADAGLHPETFWLGYATGTAAGWHPGSPAPEESMSAFCRLFYGPSAVNVGRVYQLLGRQAQFWADSWEKGPSAARKPIFGWSDGIYSPPRPPSDQTLPLPPVPSEDFLTLGFDWEKENARRLELAEKFMQESDELLDLLHVNLERAEFNHYNLEVFISIAR